ncbi:MAG TPA: spermidine/putrescine ABC transporter substrate-binding protein [Kineosporiaceae bacterium]|nr:spermidine/putrescine ABC transporter substrate-binding protein [Kineosporiaceae bacterium]
MSRRRPPLSPEAAAVLRALTGSGSPATSGLSRRALLAGAGGLGLGAVLAACGTSGTATSPGGGGSASGSTSAGPSPAQDRSDTEKIVNWANWPLYLDKSSDGKRYPTLEAFTKQTGIKATYAEDIDANETYYGKIQAQLKLGQDIGKDVIVLTDYMAGRLVRQGYVQKFDDGAIPNAKNLLPALQNVSYDPGRHYTLTWQSGYAGLAYNKQQVKTPVRTVADLWRPDLKGRVEVLDEWRDTLGLIMMSQGTEIDKPFTQDQFDKALQVLQTQLNNGQIRQVKGNSYKEDLISGDALAVIGWSGDIFQLNAENGDKWEFVLPDSGGTLWSDNLMIPIGSPHKKNAETLINYYYQPKVAAEVAAYVNYICPVQGAQAEMEKIDKNLAQSPLIFPTQTDLQKVQVFTKLEPAEETKYTLAFQKALGA